MILLQPRTLLLVVLIVVILITSLGTQLCLEAKFPFQESTFSTKNLAKNIPVVLQSSPIQIWGESVPEVPELWSDVQTNKQRLLLYICIDTTSWTTSYTTYTYTSSCTSAVAPLVAPSCTSSYNLKFCTTSYTTNCTVVLVLVLSLFVLV